MANNSERMMGRDSLGRERRQHLKGRIAEVGRMRYGNAPKVLVPAAVAKARALVEAWEAKVEKADAARRDKIHVAVRAATTELLATDSFDVGLKIVEKLEAEAKRRGWKTETPDGE